MNNIVFLALLGVCGLALVEGCAERNGFHCIEFQWNCPLNFRRSIDRWRCYDDHCCWCRDEGTNFRRLCRLDDVISTSRQQPILVNPNFNCFWCPPGFFCEFQENLGLPGPENGCSFGRFVGRFNNFNRFRQKRSAGEFDANFMSPVQKISYDISLME